MNAAVTEKFEAYPAQAKKRLLQIRALIFDVAKSEEIPEVTEALKWGEASYSCKHGSPIRIDWKPKCPNQVSIYFNCQTTLVETFREVHPSTFDYVGNREIVLALAKPLPVAELKACLSMALRYHRIKKRPLLGA